MKTPVEIAKENLENLGANPYPGRGLICGVDSSDLNMVQVYWIMGRSNNSRNRVFSSDGGRVFTEAANPAEVENPSLIIYDAMDEDYENFVVSNGDQTGNVLDALLNGEPMLDGLDGYKYEPDKPNYTPRITGACTIGSYLVELALLRRSVWGDSCDRFSYKYDSIEAGFGFCITTYSGDGNPLPPFTGEPLLMPLNGGIEDVARTYWEALNEANRVSLAVKFISSETKTSKIHIINKYSKVG